MNAKVGRIDVRRAGIVLFLFAAAPFAFARLQDAAPAKPQAPRPTTIAGIRELCQQHRYAEAARAAEGLVKEHREDPEVWMALATVHLSGDWGLRKDARAELACERALKLGGRRPDILEALATAKYRQTKYDECLPLVAELCDATPPLVRGESFADLLVIRANIALRRDALDPAARTQALADLERALQSVPGHSGARTLRADALAADGRYADALADLEVAIQSGPGNKQVHYQLHFVLTRLGRKDEAKGHYEIWKLLNRLTDSLASTSAPDAQARLAILKELREKNPADLDRRLELADLLLDQGDAAGAVRECGELLALKPGWTAAVWLRGEAARVQAGGAPRKSIQETGDGG